MQPHCHVLVTRYRISTSAEIVPLLEGLLNTGKPLLIVAEAVEGEALTLLLLNLARIRTVSVVPSLRGDARSALLSDVADFTGATLIDADLGVELNAVTPNLLGHADQVAVNKNRAFVFAGPGRRRPARTVTIPVIEVGGPTNAEAEEAFHRIQNTLAATNAARDEGVICSTASSLVHIQLALIEASKQYSEAGRRDYRLGWNAVIRAIEEPLRQIAANARLDPALQVRRVVEAQPEYGLDATTGEIVDLAAAAIVDPFRVARLALENAISVAGRMLTIVLINDNVSLRVDRKR